MRSVHLRTGQTCCHLPLTVYFVFTVNIDTNSKYIGQCYRCLVVKVVVVIVAVASVRLLNWKQVLFGESPSFVPGRLTAALENRRLSLS